MTKTELENAKDTTGQKPSMVSDLSIYALLAEYEVGGDYRDFAADEMNRRGTSYAEAMRVLYGVEVSE